MHPSKIQGGMAQTGYYTSMKVSIQRENLLGVDGQVDASLVPDRCTSTHQSIGIQSDLLNIWDQGSWIQLVVQEAS